MHRLIVAVAVSLSIAFPAAIFSIGHTEARMVYVHSYVRKDGTPVSSYYRHSPGSSSYPDGASYSGDTTPLNLSTIAADCPVGYDSVGGQCLDHVNACIAEHGHFTTYVPGGGCVCDKGYVMTQNTCTFDNQSTDNGATRRATIQRRAREHTMRQP